ncbi:hypothetical protein AB0K12_46575 [Nonomuraea sp. NPDC049419]
MAFLEVNEEVCHRLQRRSPDADAAMQVNAFVEAAGTRSGGLAGPP